MVFDCGCAEKLTLVSTNRGLSWSYWNMANVPKLQPVDAVTMEPLFDKIPFAPIVAVSVVNVNVCLLVF